MTTEESAPRGIDITKPSVARVYDFFIGGKDHFEIDRHVAEMALKITPDGPRSGRANRAFLQRGVRAMVREGGINQFLDIGSGLPTVGNVHEIALAEDPTSRVVYVENDPMALAHGRALLAGTDSVIVVGADGRKPGEVLGHAREFLDLDRPVGLLLSAILHHFTDEENPKSIADQYISALAPGSYVLISHFRDPGDRHPEGSVKCRAVEKLFNETLGTGRWRSHEEILSYFGDCELLPPGLVPFDEWRPEPGMELHGQTDTYHTFVGGLARKH